MKPGCACQPANIGSDDVWVVGVDEGALACLGDVLLVLAAARVAVLGRERQGEHAYRMPARDMSFSGVLEERVPVPHPDVYREVRHLVKSLAKALCLTHRDLGDRRDAIEHLIVTDHGIETRRRYRTAAQHVSEKRADFVPRLRSAEADEENGVKRTAVWHVNGSCHRSWVSGRIATMPKLAASVAMMFNEVELLDRFEQAAERLAFRRCRDPGPVR